MSYEVDILIVYADIVFIENLIINYVTGYFKPKAIYFNVMMVTPFKPSPSPPTTCRFGAIARMKTAISFSRFPASVQWIFNPDTGNTPESTKPAK